MNEMREKIDSKLKEYKIGIGRKFLTDDLIDIFYSEPIPPRRCTECGGCGEHWVSIAEGEDITEACPYCSEGLQYAWVKVACPINNSDEEKCDTMPECDKCEVQTNSDAMTYRPFTFGDVGKLAEWRGK